MDEKYAKPKPQEKTEDTKMTHIVSYQGPRGDELRLHDAEFQGRHYFDFRRYKKMTRGFTPLEKGLRLSDAGVGFLEDAILKWRSFRDNLMNAAHPDNPERRSSNAKNEQSLPR